MEIKAFLIGFEKSLIDNELTPEAARHHTLKIAKALSENDKRKIASFNSISQVNDLATNYVKRIRAKSQNEMAKANSDENANTAAISNNFRRTLAEDDEESIKVYPRIDKETKKELESEASTVLFTPVKTDRSSDNTDNFKTTQIKAVRKDSTPTKNTSSRASNDRTKRIDKVTTGKIQLSNEGKKEFAKRIAIKSPLIALGFAGSGIAALAVYAVIAAFIALFLALLISVIVVGGISALAGLIYGIIKIFTILPEGLYEIGFAFVVAGLTLALSICSYNVAVRFIPVLWKKFTEFLSNCFTKFKTYINKIRRECADI